MCHINESPVLLKLNPVAGRTNEVNLVSFYFTLVNVDTTWCQIK